MIFSSLNRATYSVSTKPPVLRLKFSQGEREGVCWRKELGNFWVWLSLHRIAWHHKKQDQEGGEMWFIVLASDPTSLCWHCWFVVTGYSGVRGGFVCTVYCLFDTPEPKRAEVEINLRSRVLKIGPLNNERGRTKNQSRCKDLGINQFSFKNRKQLRLKIVSSTVPISGAWAEVYIQSVWRSQPSSLSGTLYNLEYMKLCLSIYSNDSPQGFLLSKVQQLLQKGDGRRTLCSDSVLHFHEAEKIRERVCVAIFFLSLHPRSHRLHLVFVS